MDLVFSDPNLVALILDNLNQDKDVAFFFSVLVNRTFRVAFQTLRPRSSLLGTWLRAWRSVPRCVDLRKISKRLAKSRVLYNPPQSSDLLPWYAYYGFVEGIKARLETLPLRDLWIEMSTSIKIKTGDGEYFSRGIFDIVARVGNYEIFKLLWDWYLDSPLYEDDTIEELNYDEYIKSMNHRAVYLYGRDDMTQLIHSLRRDDAPMPLTDDPMDIEDLLKSRAEFYPRTGESIEESETRRFEFICKYHFSEEYNSNGSQTLILGTYQTYEVSLMLYSLTGSHRYTQFRTIAQKAWEKGFRIPENLYFQYIENLWGGTFHYSEERIIEDIRFALDLGVEATPPQSLIDLAVQAKRYQLAEFLKKLTLPQKRARLN